MASAFLLRFALSVPHDWTCRNRLVGDGAITGGWVFSTTPMAFVHFSPPVTFTINKLYIVYIYYIYYIIYISALLLQIYIYNIYVYVYIHIYIYPICPPFFCDRKQVWGHRGGPRWAALECYSEEVGDSESKNPNRWGCWS